MSRIPLLALFFFIHFHLQAQQADTLILHNSIKIDVINIYDDFPAILLSFEHPIGKRWVLNHEGGPILPMFNAYNKDIRGYKIKEEVRMFVDRWSYSDMYVGLGVRFSNEQIYESTVVGFDCSFGNCAYYQNFPGYYKKKMFSFEWRLGIRHNFDPFFFEYDIGYGFGKDIIRSPGYDLSDSGELISKHPFKTFTNSWKPMVSLRAAFGFKLKKGQSN